MKILFLEQKPRFIGGSERMSLALCRHAQVRGHATFLAYAEPGDMVDAYAAAGATVHQVPAVPIAVRNPWTALGSIRTLSRLVRAEQIDWIFTSQVSYVGLLGLVEKLTGVRTAVHLGLVYDFPSPVFRFGVRRVRLGIAPSAHTASSWTERGWPSGSLRVIPNGVDTTVFNSSVSRVDSRKALQLPAGASPLIAYVGRLVREKGIFTLMRAFAECWRATGNGYLLLVGHAPGDEVAALKLLAGELKLPDNSWGVRPSTDHPETVYRAADVVVVPSEWDEPFGLVPLEAMACGTLAVVSDRGVLPEFVAPLGRECVFPAGDATALAGCLARWTSDPEARERAAARLAAHTREHFDFARCGDAYLEALAQTSKR